MHNHSKAVRSFSIPHSWTRGVIPILRHQEQCCGSCSGVHVCVSHLSYSSHPSSLLLRSRSRAPPRLLMQAAALWIWGLTGGICLEPPVHAHLCLSLPAPSRTARAPKMMKARPCPERSVLVSRGCHHVAARNVSSPNPEALPPTSRCCLGGLEGRLRPSLFQLLEAPGLASCRSPPWSSHGLLPISVS